MTERSEAGGLHRAIWAIALPSMLANVATALFGLADLWVIGQLGRADAQAGVELGAKFMMGLLIVFNFLRTGTIALTAQAAGRGDDPEQAAALVRALGAAFLIGLVLLALMPLAIPAGLELLHARGAVADSARTYVGIRYWGGLLWLANAALVGWLIGRKRVRAVLAIEVVANIVHIGLDLLFVLGFGWGVAGVAFATLLSEGLKLGAAAMVAAREPPAAGALRLAFRAETWERSALLALMRLNRDLFLRTLLLTGAILLLVRDGAHEGAVVLAANGILYQLFILSALILDGFESAAQVLCGEAVGARDRARFDRLVPALLLWGLGFGAAISLVYALAGAPFAASFSTDPAVAATTLAYLPWAMALPFVGVTSYVLDGIYIGATWTRALLVTMGAAFALYGLLLLATGPLGNHGLWLAFALFLVVRAAGQMLLLPRLRRSTFA
ncbi:MATE family efflux transporter [Sphingosinicella sp. CPCC 101087]|uniref:MATE family efflux transporter n=1 Tax=Sphingosinicella sp. CPCC 101087 TaxID=2497754 RepID=UPI001FB1726C|nr:MATE family efflux transporter [Sphingosinicella sp. CPCC 101087]